MDEIVETIHYKDHIIEICYDLDAPSPRDWADHVGIFLTTDGLNESDLDAREVSNEVTPIRIISDYEGDEIVALLNVYKYSHSGERYNTTGFSSIWDSGQTGWIYTTKSRAAEWLGEKFTEEQVIQVLKAEVEEVDNWCVGYVYGYRIYSEDDPDQEIESCWTFFDDVPYVINEAKSSVDCMYRETMTVPETRVPLIELLGA